MARDREFKAKKDVETNKFCYVSNLLPQAKTPLFCQIFTHFLCLKGIKAAYFGHFFEPHIFGVPVCVKLNSVVFLQLMFYVNFIVRPAKKNLEG